MDFFRKLFGFPDQQSQRPETPYPPLPDDHQRYFDFEDDNVRLPTGGSFHVFTDPLEMHRYFEQQMDGFLKQFGIPGFGNYFHPFEHPELQDETSQEENHQHPREQFIRKGFDGPAYEHPRSDQKVDKDLDGKLNITGIDSFTSPNKEQTNSLNRCPVPFQFGGTFFNESVQVNTIRRSDGSYETHRIVTDSDGNQETTISKKMGDREYMIVKKRDKEGKEKINETMINMTEDEKSLLEKVSSVKLPFDETLFRKFFK